MKVINLLAEPSAGKSTTAAGLFFLMKQAGMNVELIDEYAKQCVWENRHKTLDDQLYVSAKQNHKLERLRGKVDYVITDSPLLLGILYSRESSRYPSFHSFLLEVFNSYDNFNVLITRTKPYVQAGRIQNEEQAKIVRASLVEILETNGVPFYAVDGNPEAPQKIFSLLTSHQTGGKVG